MAKIHESVEVTNRVKRDKGMGDPKDADAAEDRDNDLAAGRPVRSLAELEASREAGNPHGDARPIEGTSAFNVGGPRGGGKRCGNPMGYGHCEGLIDDDDPVGRCSRCGIPTKAAIYENMGQSMVAPDGDPAPPDHAQGIVSIDRSGAVVLSAMAREGARLALTRQIHAAYWIDKGIDRESDTFNPKDPKIRSMTQEVERLVIEAFKRAGLLPRAAA